MEMKFLHANYIRRPSMNGKSTHSWTEHVRRITKNGEGSAMIDEFVNSFRFIFIYCMRCRWYYSRSSSYSCSLNRNAFFYREVLFLVLETTKSWSYLCGSQFIIICSLNEIKQFFCCVSFLFLLNQFSFFDFFSLSIFMWKINVDAPHKLNVECV